ncbi:MAG TPA: FGGY-family carbohydrate kinase [Acidimicrobiales bacterium]|jgi:xylulokinase|nr:FGGY-family carbohydrate kinase [Acidimicrobiales bacterium]
MTPTSHSEGLAVGIDIGTTSVKAVAADADGNVVARARVPHRVVVPEAEKFEHDADEAWRRGPREALRELKVDDIAAISVTGMVPSLCAVDAEGVPRTPGLIYGDVRGRTGSGADPSGSGETAAFLRWTANEAPDAFGYWPAQAVANYALCGEPSLDTATAFSAYPLFDGNVWDEKALAEVGATPEQFPPVHVNGAAVGRVGDAILGASSIDAMGEQLVAGADRDGDVMVILGTTLIVWVLDTGWREVPGLWTIPHLGGLENRSFIGGASNAGGLFLNWALRLTEPTSEQPVPDRVPVWEPYVRGERTPYHDPHRRAVLHDLDLTHDAAAVRRAAYEASGFVTRQHIDMTGVDAKRIVATGGGVRVREWVQALADCTQLPVDVVAVPEGAALGAAFMARVAAGLEPDMAAGARWASTSHTVDPDPAWAGPVAARYRRFRELAG